jgi:hypothetical protein
MLFPCQGFVCEGVVGEDVVKLLEKAIQRHPDMDIEVRKKYLFQILTCFFKKTRYYRNFVVFKFFSLMAYISWTKKCALSYVILHITL